jgi:hypothetical protein
MGRWGEILSASPDASVTIFECNLIMTGTENRRSHPRQGSETILERKGRRVRAYVA